MTIGEYKRNKYCKDLYQDHYTNVFVFVQRRIEDENKTSAIVKEVFIQAFDDLLTNEIRDVSKLTHLYKISTEMCDKSVEQINTRYVHLSDEMTSDMLDQMGSISNRQSAIQKLKRLVNALSLREIQLLELRFSERTTFYDGGYILKISEQMAKLKTYRLLGKMHHMINS